MHRVVDAIPLPGPGDPLIGRASRVDTYPIAVTATAEDAMRHLCRFVGDAAVAVLTDETVEELLGGLLVRALRAAGKDPLFARYPAGEASKSLDQAVGAWHWLADTEFARRDVLIAFGGGVVTDLGGWVASGYMRGIPYVNVPTTLLAQVDGALGGKVAANHPLAKNLLGAFHRPPRRRGQRGLPRQHERAALAGRPGGGDQEGGDRVAVVLAVHRRSRGGDPRAPSGSARAARAVGGGDQVRAVERDPVRDATCGAPLNFGHTIGHPLETVTGYGPLLHGEAVAFGMVVEARIACGRGLLRRARSDCARGAAASVRPADAWRASCRRR